MIKEVIIGYLSKRQKVNVIGSEQEHRVEQVTVPENNLFYMFRYAPNGEGDQIDCYARVTGLPFTVWDLDGGLITFPQMLRPLFEASQIIGGESLPAEFTPVVLAFDLVGLHLNKPTLDIQIARLPRAKGE